MTDVTPITATEFRHIRRLIQELCGIAISDDKEYLVVSRLQSVLRNHRFAAFSDLIRGLQAPNALTLRDELIEAMTTHETSFLRDQHPFEALRRHVLPELAHHLRSSRHLSGRSRIRIWSAGSSTGQEAYSLALTAADVVAQRPDLELRLEDFAILASDISSRALAIARDGKYRDYDIERGISADHKTRYLQPVNGSWQFIDSLRQVIEFRRINLIEPFSSLGSFDLICCRNVLIYFDSAARQRICEQFHRSLASKGMLILGAAESLYGISDQFQSELFGPTVVYRKR